MGCCENCKRWEKDTYWNRFQVVHFFTVLPTDPHLQLRFPEKFVKNLKKELSIAESVILYGPSGHAWNVELMRNVDGDLVLQNGWQEFVNDHNLIEDDVLFFKYKGEFRFDVLMFDRSNSCEKESTYFVKKCTTTTTTTRECNCNDDHEVMMNENNKRTERPEPSLEIIHNSSAEPASTRSKKKLHTHREEIINDIQRRGGLPASRGHAKSFSASKRSLIIGRTPTLSIRPVPKPIIKIEEEEEEEDSEEEEDEEINGDLNRAYPLHFVSRRRAVTVAEKNRVYELAVRAGANSKMPHFIVVMQPSHVSFRFYMTVPAESARSYFPRKNEDVILRREGKNWPAKYNRYKKNSGICGVGWSDFVLENNLEVGDVCLFELCAAAARKKQGTMVLDVGIFQVVKEVVPLIKKVVNR